MSYPIDLDEYATDTLLGELRRRANLRARGLCDYCERAPTTPHCKFPDRHSQVPTAHVRQYQLAQASILSALSTVGEPISIHNIVSRTGLPRWSAYSALNVLRIAGLVHTSGTRRERKYALAGGA